jgi:hypothetical protein
LIVRCFRWVPPQLFLSAFLAPLPVLGTQAPPTAPVPTVQSDSFYRLGLSLLHRGTVEDGRYFDRARNAFRKAHALDPDWVDPILGIGLAEGKKGDWLAGEPLNIGTRVGHGAYRSAIGALLLGMWAGNVVGGRIPQTLFRQIVLGGLLLLGANMVVRSVLSF